MRKPFFLHENSEVENTLRRAAFSSLFVLVAAFIAGCEPELPLEQDTVTMSQDLAKASTVNALPDLAVPVVATVTELGAVQNPATVTERDAGFTSLSGSQVLWTFGDTFFNTTSEDGKIFRANTAAVADLSNPLATRETLDNNGTPYQALPFTVQEQAFNDSTNDPLDRIAIWIGGLVPYKRGALAFYSKLHVTGLLNYGFLGVGTAYFRPGKTQGVRNKRLLFSADEPQFVKAFRHGDMIYLYGGIQGGGLAQPYFVARAPLKNVTRRSAYRFWNGTDWDLNVSAAAPVLQGVGSGLTFFYNCYLGCFTAVYSPVFSNKVVMRTAPSPEGQWSSPIELFTGMPSFNGSLNRQGKQHAELAQNTGKTIFASYFRLTGPYKGEVRLVEVTFQ